MAKIKETESTDSFFLFGLVKVDFTLLKNDPPKGISSYRYCSIFAFCGILLQMTVASIQPFPGVKWYFP